MDPTTAERQLAALWGDIDDLEAAIELLQWDQETHMPTAGEEGRAKLLSTLTGLRHGRLCAPELGEAIDRCAELAREGSVAAAQAREARRVVERAQRVPADLSRALAEATARAFGAWERAYQASDFSLLDEHLTELVRLKREQAAALAAGGDPYEALLTEFEPNATRAELERLLGAVRPVLTELVAAVAESGERIDLAPLKGSFPAARQLELGRWVATAMGFDFAAGRIDRAAHPACFRVGSRDLRITWRCCEHDFQTGLFALIHETGHGLYEQGIFPRWQRSPLGGAASAGMHEAQARLWENMVGRGQPFWQWALPQVREKLGLAPEITAEQIWRALHTVQPGLRRVEADEATYNLHIIIRTELEEALLSGELAVAELPGAWDDAYERLLRLRPARQAEGVLQDVHWAVGAFAYFPTYTIGNLIGAQLFEAALQQVDDLPERIAKGDFSALLGWLRERIHVHGRRYSAAELVEQATGQPLGPAAFLRHLTTTAEQVYGICLPPVSADSAA